MNIAVSKTQKTRTIHPKIDFIYQIKLIEVWKQHNIPEFYEELFIHYLKKTDKFKAQIIIKQEIKSITNFSSQIQDFLKALNDKQKVQDFIMAAIRKDNGKISEKNVSIVYHYISKLRQSNYKATYSLQKIKGKYEDGLPTKSIQKQFFNNFAICIDIFRKQHLYPYLRRFVIFEEDYDPFYMNIKQEITNVNKKIHSMFLDLNNLQIEDSYKYLKFKKILYSWMINKQKQLGLSKNKRRFNSIEFPQIHSQIILKDHAHHGTIDFSPLHLQSAMGDNSPYNFDKTRYNNIYRTRHRKISQIGVIKKNNQTRLKSQAKYREQSHDSINKFQHSSDKDRKQENEDLQHPIRAFKPKIGNQVSSFSASNAQIIHEKYNIKNQLYLNKIMNPSLAMLQNQYRKKVSSKFQNTLLINISINPLPKPSQVDLHLQSTQHAFNHNQKTKILPTNLHEVYIPQSPSQMQRKSQEFSRRQSQKKAEQLKRKKAQQRKLQLQQRQQQLNRKQFERRSQQLKLKQLQQKSQELKRRQIQKKAEQLRKKQLQLKQIQLQRRQQQKKMQELRRKQYQTKNQELKLKQLQLKAQQLQRKQFQMKAQQLHRRQLQIKAEQLRNRQLQKKAQQLRKRQLQMKAQELKKKQLQNIAENIRKRQMQMKAQQLRRKQQALKASHDVKKQPIQKKESIINGATDQKANIQVRAGKLTIQELKQYLSSYNYNEDYLKIFDLNKILKFSSYNQTYFTQFLVNNEPSAIGLSSLMPPQNTFAIKFWSISKSTDPKLAQFLFNKYIEYIEKCIINESIFYKGELFRQLSLCGFELIKQNLYSHKRKSKPREIVSEFQQFIYCQCSQINFIQKQQDDIFFSKELQPFHLDNSYAPQFLFNTKSQNCPSTLQTLIRVQQNISNFMKVNSILDEEGMDGYEINKKNGTNGISGINLTKVIYQSHFKDVFIASDGYFKFYGTQIYNQQQQVVYSVKLTNNNGRICFGKGFKSIQEFSIRSKNEQTSKKSHFFVPMFSKNLYGRYNKIDRQGKSYYGNWLFSLVWEDQMLGVVKQKVKSQLQLGALFYVSIELQNIQLYCFKVENDDFVY